MLLSIANVAVGWGFQGSAVTVSHIILLDQVLHVSQLAVVQVNIWRWVVLIFATDNQLHRRHADPPRPRQSHREAAAGVRGAAAGMAGGYVRYREVSRGHWSQGPLDHPSGRPQTSLQPSGLPKGLEDLRPAPNPPATSLEASTAILARSGQGSADGDGLAICKPLQLIAFVAEGRGDRGRHDPAIFPSATPIPRGRGRLIAKRRRAGVRGGAAAEHGGAGYGGRVAG